MDTLDLEFQWHDHDGINSNRIQQTDFSSAFLPGTSAATAGNYGIFFIATRPVFVKAISEVHTTKGTGAGTVTVERLQSSQAPDSGNELITIPFNIGSTSTANVVQEGALVSGNKTQLFLNIGDRLCLKDNGTLTTLAGLCITVELQFK